LANVRVRTLCEFGPYMAAICSRGTAAARGHCPGDDARRADSDPRRADLVAGRRGGGPHAGGAGAAEARTHDVYQRPPAAAQTVVLEHGRVVEHGTHDELAASGEHYRPSAG